MNILITGSTGFLGKEVVNILKANKYSLTLLVRKKIKRKNYINCDLNDKKKLRYILNKINPNIIINLAAEVEFKKNTKNMYKVNSLGVYEIAKFCKQKGIHLIQSSGTIVHGLKKKYNKRTKFNPVNHYGKSKLRGDNLILKSNCKHTILRFGGIYGKNGPHHLGLNKFIDFALKKKEIKFYGNKKSLRNYIFVKDAAKTIMHCLKHKKYGIFYVGGEILSFEYMLKKIGKILTKKNSFHFINMKKKIDHQIIESNKIIQNTTFIKSLKLIK